MRHLAFGCAISIIMFMVMALVAGHVVRDERFAVAVIAFLFEKTGGQIEFAGNVEMRFMPRLRVILHDVSIELPSASCACAPPRLRADALYVDVALWKFITRRQFALSAIRIQGLDAALSIHAHPHFAALRDLNIHRIHLDDSVIALQLTDDTMPHKIAPLVISNMRGVLKLDDALMANLEGQVNAQDWQLKLRFAPSTFISGRVPLNVKLSSTQNQHIDFEGFYIASTDVHLAQINGVIDLHAPQAIRTLLAPLGVRPKNASDMGLSLHGAVVLNAQGFRANHLRMEALARPFALKLDIDWPHHARNMHIVAHLEGDELDFDKLDTHPALVATWHEFFIESESVFDITVDKILWSGGVVRNATLRGTHHARQFPISRLNADLPFDSSILSSGAIRWPDGHPVF